MRDIETNGIKKSIKKAKKTKNRIIIDIFILVVGINIGMIIGMNIGKKSKKSEETTTVSGYESAVKEIEARYKDGYPEGKIVMYGSSSFRFWETMEEDMAPLEVLNHGFGGATLDDAFNYADRLVTAFKPKAVVIYCGTNDLGGMSDGTLKNAKMAYMSSVSLMEYINEQLPKTKVIYVASSPQPLRMHKWDEEHKCNELMKEYCDGNDYCYYIDTEDALLDENGNYYEEYYLDDGIHFSEEGYIVWGKKLKEEITKIVGEK